MTTTANLSDLSLLGGGAGLFSGVTRTADATARRFQRTFADTRGGAFTLTLDPAAQEGDRVQVEDLWRSWSTHQLTLVAASGISIDAATQLNCKAAALLEYAFQGGAWRLVLAIPLGAYPAGLDIEQVIAPAPPPGDGVSDLEFNGPFVDWLDVVRDYAGQNPDPTGTTECSAAIQAMINDMAMERRNIGVQGVDPDEQIYRPFVGGIPAGTYLIGSTILVPSSGDNVAATFEDKSLFGTGNLPTDVILKWVGAPGGTIMWMNGCHTSVIGRLTFDLSGSAKIGIRFERDTALELTSQSYNQIRDCQFINPAADGSSYAIFNTQFGTNTGTDSELEIIRCRAIGAFNRGICNTGYQAFNYWARHFYAEGNSVAISNGDSGLSEFFFPYDGNNAPLVNSTGSFGAFDCIFNGSSFLDVQMWGSNPTTVRRNFSINGRRFCELRAGLFEVVDNTVIDPIDSTSVAFPTFDRGGPPPPTPDSTNPEGRHITVLVGGKVRSRGDAAGPVIAELFDTDLDAAHLAIAADQPGTLQLYQQSEPIFFAQGCAFSAAYGGLIGTDPNWDNTTVLDTATGQTIDGTIPLRVPFPPKVARQVFVIGRNGGELAQTTVDAAAAYALANPGSQPVVYHPNHVHVGVYNQLGAPVIFPANVKMSLQGCGAGPRSIFYWTGDPYDETTPVVLLRGPSKISIHNHGICRMGAGDSGAKNGRMVLVDNCDQPGARIYSENSSGYSHYVGCAHLVVELLDHLYSASRQTRLPMRVIGHATVAGEGRVLMEGGTISNDRSDAASILVESGGWIDTRYIWFESDVTDQVNIQLVGSGPRPARFCNEASRWVTANQTFVYPGGENWRFVQMTAADFDGLIMMVATEMLGSLALSGDCSKTDIFNLGGDVANRAGDPTPRTMYRNHGFGNRLERLQAATPDHSPMGVTGALPSNYAAILQSLVDIKPTRLIADLADGVTDVRLYRVGGDDFEFMAAVY